MQCPWGFFFKRQRPCKNDTIPFLSSSPVFLSSCQLFCQLGILLPSQSSFQCSVFSVEVLFRQDRPLLSGSCAECRWAPFRGLLLRCCWGGLARRRWTSTPTASCSGNSQRGRHPPAATSGPSGAPEQIFKVLCFRFASTVPQNLGGDCVVLLQMHCTPEDLPVCW